MGDAPIAYVEGAGGTRIAEEQVVAVGKNDACLSISVHKYNVANAMQILSFKVGR